MVFWIERVMDRCKSSENIGLEGDGRRGPDAAIYIAVFKNGYSRSAVYSRISIIPKEAY
jgi:hypothetical protein